MRPAVHSCCEDGLQIDLSKMALPGVFLFVNWDWNFIVAAFWIVFYPLFWLMVSRWEQRRGTLTWLCGGRYLACLLVAVSLITMSVYRDWRYLVAVRGQPEWWALRQNWILWSGHTLILLGAVFVVSSYHLLGFWATFIGDYFGIHDRQRMWHVFPYTWLNNPMYWGAAMIFLGVALVGASFGALLLASLATFMYQVAIILEEPYRSLWHRCSAEVGVQAEITPEDISSQDADDEEDEQDGVTIIKGQADEPTGSEAQRKTPMKEEEEKEEAKKTR